MADSYIDYQEVEEYGNHFVQHVTSLEGASPLVDVAVLGARVQEAVKTVAAEMDKTGIKRSGVRDGKGSTTELSAAMLDVIERFYFHLRSLPKDTVLDFEAFFPKRNLGSLASLKASDMLKRGSAVLRGFASNAALTQLEPWQSELSAAHAALAAVVDAKGGAKTDSLKATTALQTARQDFLKIYNQIAKPLVKTVLTDLGRANEYRLFFLDLQVNEGGSSKSPETPPKNVEG